MVLQRYQPNLFDIHWNKIWIRFSYQVPVWKANEFPSRHRLVKGETSHHWMRSTWMSYREDERRENEVWGFMGIEQTKRYQQEGGSNHKLKKKLDQIGIRPKKYWGTSGGEQQDLSIWLAIIVHQLKTALSRWDVLLTMAWIFNRYPSWKSPNPTPKGLS